ncbi:DUF1187 family protein [Salmonella enterica subsp. enterica serovar Muenchen]|uniref:DUF1187 family protein n=1 Tax=Salmonella enterica subsp. enterica serovar Ank TaxID=1173578 RepID=A0A726YIC4_SALET|nr:DUF1187 family protein [Salmonella enterica subsp. enterica serovar Muenchen]HAE1794681.1 DUF1187 family protein [Salmonella enterica subsp. enterica serovar Ank]
MKGKKYKITATIHKAGNPPVAWSFYSETRLTQKQCEMRFYKPKEAGRTAGERVKLENFECSSLGESDI